jgi:transposase-like protein
MQREEDRAVMHALCEGHGWSIARIAREFDVNWRTALRHARGDGAVRYPERVRPAELTEARRGIGRSRRSSGHDESRTSGAGGGSGASPRSRGSWTWWAGSRFKTGQR